MESGRLRRPLVIVALWFVFYSTFALLAPPLLDDADSVHAEVAREMLVRHDWTTLYANGIRYLEKAPLLYWSMASSFKIFGVGTAAARLPLALTVLALALVVEAFARRAFGASGPKESSDSGQEEAETEEETAAVNKSGARAGLYAGLILLSSFGIFIFTRITIPDAMVCLWLTLSIFCYWLTEQQSRPGAPLCYGFALCCALNILTKGLIGIVFPIGIVLLHLLFTRGLRGTIARLRQLHPFGSLLVFLLVAAPWHILIALANPTQGHPGEISFTKGHWIVPQPTDGNVHGWTWFYFVNEHLLRYLNLRVPRDYDTVPLFLFWGLLLIWLMPWSAFLFHALAAVPWRRMLRRAALDRQQSTLALMGIWAMFPMLFFSFSTRQEYYVLPALPALIMLIALWLSREADEAESFAVPNLLVIAGQRISLVLLAFGSLATFAAFFFLVHSQPAAPNMDLASLLQQNPSEYALSFGHFLDLNSRAMGAFRRPLGLTGLSLFTATLAACLLRRAYRPHAANLWLTGGAFGFLLAAHLGLQIFSPVLTSKQLADVIAPYLKPEDILVIHGEYEAGSTLGFYLKRNNLHIFEGRSSNLWYGGFFPDAPHIFETETTLNLEWTGPHRVFLWQDVSQPLPRLRGRSYVLIQSGGKEILSNRPN
ncbi:phospholipid carrier-dependent glycosyltransferase [Edaphobacter modestus]|uniref:phospholipid carrier-dependent glycosyltransferase n=1 Tax=Edaphobacter modestus TaxID=388466 RepID=UPI001F5EC2FF|nr:phospholipid carrier-dependent glycosyltransferase [Edaphobacter modestus]